MSKQLTQSEADALVAYVMLAHSEHDYIAEINTLSDDAKRHLWDKLTHYNPKASRADVELNRRGADLLRPAMMEITLPQQDWAKIIGAQP